MPSYTCDSHPTLTCLFRATLTLKWHGKKLNETSWSVGFGNADITKHRILKWHGKKLNETSWSVGFANADITKHLILKWHGEEKKRKKQKKKKLHETNRSAGFWNADITKHLILKWHGEEKKKKKKEEKKKKTARNEPIGWVLKRGHYKTSDSKMTWGRKKKKKNLHETNRSAGFWNADITKHLILKWHGGGGGIWTKRVDRLALETLTLQNIWF